MDTLCTVTAPTQRPKLTRIDLSRLLIETVTRCFSKKGVRKCLVKFTGKHFYYSLLLIKFTELQKKETPAQVFSCKFCNIFTNIYCVEHLEMGLFL